ncbi:unnamed protein product, partial [Didymodactylos carnosus]
MRNIVQMCIRNLLVEVTICWTDPKTNLEGKNILCEQIVNDIGLLYQDMERAK